MRPEKAENGGDEESFDAWLALQRVTDATRADIVADIVGHPEQAPSVDELDYVNRLRVEPWGLSVDSRSIRVIRKAYNRRSRSPSLT